MVWFSIIKLLAGLPFLELWGAPQFWFCTAFPICYWCEGCHWPLLMGNKILSKGSASVNTSCVPT